jgi:hypothetical protein
MKTRLILDINKTQYAQLNSIVTGRVGDKASNTVDVYVVDGFIPYNLTGSDVYFECAKPDNTSVRDKNGITIIDAAKGHFEYTFPTQTFASVGKSKQAYFTIEKNSTVKATTQDFIIVSLPDALTNRIPSKTYISQLDQLIEELREMALQDINSKAAQEAHDALVKAQDAKAIAQSVQNQLNTIVIEGDSSVEAAQARIEKDGTVHETLKAHTDAIHDKIEILNKKATEISIMEYENFVVNKDLPDEDWKPALDEAFRVANGKTLIFPDGIYQSSAVTLPTGWSGKVTGRGILKAISSMSINSLVTLNKVTNVTWEVNIDMAQNILTTKTDPRCLVGITLTDCRSTKINNCTCTNVRVGRPLIIDGNSSVNPISTDGSQNIEVNNMRCVAYSYDIVDEGAYIIIRSSFYNGDGGGIYMPASNGLKKSDMTIDTVVSYKQTTKNVKFNNCYFENFDRIAILNVDGIDFNNCTGINFYTRGYNFSPTVFNATVNGGSITGGTASTIPFAYGCKNCVVNGVRIDSLGGTAGEQTALKAYYGCSDIIFSNITGIGGSQRHIYVHSSKRIKFSNVNLRKHINGTVNSISVSGGDKGNIATYSVDDITIDNCTLESNYGIALNEFTGNATISLGAVKISKSAFEKSHQLFNASYTLPAKGEVVFLFNTAKKSGNTQDLSSNMFKYFDGNDVSCNMVSQKNMTGPTTFVEFDIQYYVPERDGSGGDNTRNPTIDVYKNGQILFYGIDYFCDGTMAGTMTNKIRMYTPSSLVNGDKLTLIRRK